MAALVSAETMTQLTSEQWKERLEGVGQLAGYVEGKEELETADVMAMMVVLENRTKGWKETNFQVGG